MTRASVLETGLSIDSNIKHFQTNEHETESNSSFPSSLPMTIDASESSPKTFFDYFDFKSQSNSLLYFCNFINDLILGDSFSPDDDSIKEFNTLLNRHSGDVVLNKFISKFFIPELSSFEFKNTIQSIKSFPTISYKSAFEILRQIYTNTLNDNIKRYILFLTLSPVDLYIKFDTEFKNYDMNYRAFDHYIEDQLDIYITYLISNNKLTISKSLYTLLGFICKESSYQITNPEYMNIEFDTSLLKNVSIENGFNSIFIQILNSNKENNTRFKGLNGDGTFKTSIQLLSLISSSWDRMSATSALRNKPMPSFQVNHTLIGGARFDDSSIVKIFSGDYNLIPESYKDNTPVMIDLITNYKLFNQLSSRRKAQVCSFLYNNRTRFNSILENATKSVMNVIQNSINGGISDALRESQILSRNLRGGSQTNNMIQEFTNDTKSFVMSLQSSYSKNKIKTFSDAIDFIIHDYIPLVNQFNSRCFTKFGSLNHCSIMNSFASNRKLCILGGGLFLNDEPTSKPTQPTPTAPISNLRSSIQPKEVIKYIDSPAVEKEVYVSLSGGNSSNDLIEAFVNGQKQFNKDYEILYRNITNELNKIVLENVQERTYNKLFIVCSQFESIAIKNPMTTIYLSGYYGAKDYNKMYTKAVTNVVNQIKSTGLTEFNGVVAVLEKLVNLLTETRKRMLALRNKYISSPKKISEIFIISSSGIKQPCRLTNADFIALNDAVARLNNTIKSYINKSAIAETTAQLNDYVNHVKNRDLIIKEHYADLILIEKTRYNNIMDVKRNASIARDVAISLLEQKRDVLLYLNNIVDSQFTADKIKKLNASITQAQIKTIEDAYVAFSNMKITPEFNVAMRKISKFLQAPESHVGNIYKFIRKLKKLITSSRYFKFFESLYKELKLFGNEFNWGEFSNNMSTLITISSIIVSMKKNFVLKNNSKQVCREKLIHDLAISFEKFCQSFPYDANYPFPVNSAYLLIRDVFRSYVSSTDVFENQFKYDGIQGNAASLNQVANISDASFNQRITNSTEVRYKSYRIQGNGTIGFDQNNNKETINSLLTAFFGAGHTISKDAYQLFCKVVDYVIQYQEMPSAPLPFFISNIGLLLYYISKLDDTNEFGKEVINIINVVKEETNSNLEYEFFVDSFNRSSYENELVKSTIEALTSNVLAIIDNYWDIRYRGTLRLPLNISTVLRGGNNEDLPITGGSVFDSKILHDQTFSTIIPEATPFYICAINVIYYYINCYSTNKTEASNELTLLLEINKISTLYPIYDIFKNQGATIKSLTSSQLSIIVSILNTIWDQTQGEPSAKLTRAIDYIFSELNGCIIFTNEIQKAIIKNTRSLSNSTFDVIGVEINKIVDKMKDVIRTSIVDNFVSPEDQARYFETQMSQAYQRIKHDPENRRMITLKAILLDEHGVNDRFNEYFKFMELVMVPMLITGISYANIFALFDSYTLIADNSFEGETLDFRKINVSYPDIVNNPNGQYMAVSSAWDLIQKIVQQRQYHLKSVLVDHPIVISYNKILLYNALEELHISGKFTLPKFWLILDEKTYPQSPTVQTQSHTKGTEYGINDNTVLLRQLYPTIHAKTLADYYNQAVSEFYSDFDHCVHNFVSYPGISDKVIMNISQLMHNSLSVDRKDKHFIELIDLQTNDPRAKDIESKFSRIQIRKSGAYIFPPVIGQDFILPRFEAGVTNTFDDLKITTLSKDEHGFYNTRIDGLGLYIQASNLDSSKAHPQSIKLCNYHWFDWVVIMLSKCDFVNHCIPVKLASIFKDNHEIGQLCQTAYTVSKTANTLYSQSANGSYNNLLTQNILGRSFSIINNDKRDYMQLSPSWIAALISTTPYIINTLNSVKDSIREDVNYQGINVNRELSVLIEILTVFFDDIQNYSPFMGFMTDTVQLSSDKVKPHPFAELLLFVEKNNVNTMNASDFIRMSWANPDFFSSIDSIVFPAYKNKDKFEWIKEYAKDKINNGVFSSEFANTCSVLGRNVWAALIAKSVDYDASYKNINRELDTLILKCINILSECDQGIIQRYLDNVVRVYNRTTSGEMTRFTGGTNGSMTGGDYPHENYTNVTYKGSSGNEALFTDLFEGIGAINKESPLERTIKEELSPSSSETINMILYSTIDVIKKHDKGSQLAKSLTIIDDYLSAVIQYNDFAQFNNADIDIEGTKYKPLNVLPKIRVPTVEDIHNSNTNRLSKKSTSSLQIRGSIQKGLDILTAINPGYKVLESEFDTIFQTFRGNLDKAIIDEKETCVGFSTIYANVGKVDYTSNSPNRIIINNAFDQQNNGKSLEDGCNSQIPEIRLIYQTIRIIYTLYIYLLQFIAPGLSNAFDVTNSISNNGNILGIFNNEIKTQTGIDMATRFSANGFNYMLDGAAQNVKTIGNVLSLNNAQKYNMAQNLFTELISSVNASSTGATGNALLSTAGVTFIYGKIKKYATLTKNMIKLLCTPIITGFVSGYDVGAYYNLIKSDINETVTRFYNIVQPYFDNNELAKPSRSHFVVRNAPTYPNLEVTYNKDATTNKILLDILLVRPMIKVSCYKLNDVHVLDTMWSLLDVYYGMIFTPLVTANTTGFVNDIKATKNTLFSYLSNVVLTCAKYAGTAVGGNNPNFSVDVFHKIFDWGFSAKQFVFGKSAGDEQNYKNNAEKITSVLAHGLNQNTADLEETILLKVLQGWGTMTTNLGQGLQNNRFFFTQLFERRYNTSFNTEYLDNANSDKISIDYANLTGGIMGGILNLSEEETILNGAKIIATNISARAIYQDPAIQLKPISPSVLWNPNNTAGNNEPDFSLYNYKYLYNPTLATPFNKTRFEVTDFVNLAIGGMKRFIIQPKYSENYAEAIKIKHKVENGSYGFEYNKVNGFDKGASNPVSLDNATWNFVFKNGVKLLPKMTQGELQSTVNLNSTAYQYNSYQNTVLRKQLTLSPSMMVVPDTDVVINRKPTVNMIHFDERMLQNVYFSKNLEQEIYSPQRALCVITSIFEDNYNMPSIKFSLASVEDCVKKAGEDLFIPYYDVLMNLVDDYNYGTDYPINVKNLTDFSSDIKRTPIHRFIEDLINTQLNDFKQYTKRVEFGFDTGSLIGKGLFGGDINVNLSFNHSFINPNATFNSFNGEKVLSNVYLNGDINEDLFEYQNGKLIYDNVFGPVFSHQNNDYNSLMFSYIINYFHKYNISYNAIYDRLCFPSIIFGSSVLNAFLPKLADKIKEMKFDESTDSSKNSVFKFIIKYLTGIVYKTNEDDYKLTFDFAKHPEYQVLFQNKPGKEKIPVRDADMPFELVLRLITEENNDNTLPDAIKNLTLWLSNQYSAPSVANNFFSAFVDYTTYTGPAYKHQHDSGIHSKVTDELFKHTDNLYAFLGSNFMSTIRHLDSVSTLIYVLFMLLKQTSFYSVEDSRDTSYFNEATPDPLSAK